MNKLANQIEAFSDALIDGAELCEQTLYLSLGRCTLALRSNSAELIQRLKQYFSHIITTPIEADLNVIAIERLAPDLSAEMGIDFEDWLREPGKVGRKDSVYDFTGGRLVRKVRTGMVFLQSGEQRIAAGPCLENDNQVVNFVNAQYMSWLQQRQWLTCHAAGLVVDGKALAMAGFSGGGKSTLMLHTLENPKHNFLSNDRLMIKREKGVTQSAGIPKQPRINPGTIVNNPRLYPLIDEARRETLLALPTGELWNLEEKFDAMVEELYGDGRITTDAPLTAFIVLNWHWGSDEPTEMKRVDIAQRRDLLKAIMKSPGPFYQHVEGDFHQATAGFDEEAYIAALDGVKVYEASGKVDFELMAKMYIEEALS